jgi:predicted Zn-dependent protease
MAREIEEIKRILLEGQRRTMQGSYKRRAPAGDSVPLLLQARTSLKEYLKEQGDDVEAWRLLSQADKCLLNYSAARQACERAMSLSGVRDKKDLKRLVLLRE